MRPLSASTSSAAAERALQAGDDVDDTLWLGTHGYDGALVRSCLRQMSSRRIHPKNKRNAALFLSQRFLGLEQASARRVSGVPASNSPARPTLKHFFLNHKDNNLNRSTATLNSTHLQEHEQHQLLFSSNNTTTPTTASTICFTPNNLSPGRQLRSKQLTLRMASTRVEAPQSTRRIVQQQQNASPSKQQHKKRPGQRENQGRELSGFSDIITAVYDGQEPDTTIRRRRRPKETHPQRFLRLLPISQRKSQTTNPTISTPNSHSHPPLFSPRNENIWTTTATSCAMDDDISEDQDDTITQSSADVPSKSRRRGPAAMKTSHHSSTTAITKNGYRALTDDDDDDTSQQPRINDNDNDEEEDVRSTRRDCRSNLPLLIKRSGYAKFQPSQLQVLNELDLEKRQQQQQQQQQQHDILPESAHTGGSCTPLSNPTSSNSSSNSNVRPVHLYIPTDVVLRMPSSRGAMLLQQISNLTDYQDMFTSTRSDLSNTTVNVSSLDDEDDASRGNKAYTCNGDNQVLSTSAGSDADGNDPFSEFSLQLVDPSELPASVRMQRQTGWLRLECLVEEDYEEDQYTDNEDDDDDDDYDGDESALYYGESESDSGIHTSCDWASGTGSHVGAGSHVGVGPETAATVPAGSPSRRHTVFSPGDNSSFSYPTDESPCRRRNTTTGISIESGKNKDDDEDDVLSPLQRSDSSITAPKLLDQAYANAVSELQTTTNTSPRKPSSKLRSVLALASSPLSSLRQLKGTKEKAMPSLPELGHASCPTLMQSDHLYPEVAPTAKKISKPIFGRRTTDSQAASKLQQSKERIPRSQRYRKLEDDEGKDNSQEPFPQSAARDKDVATGDFRRCRTVPAGMRLQRQSEIRGGVLELALQDAASERGESMSTSDEGKEDSGPAQSTGPGVSTGNVAESWTAPPNEKPPVLTRIHSANKSVHTSAWFILVDSFCEGDGESYVLLEHASDQPASRSHDPANDDDKRILMTATYDDMAECDVRSMASEPADMGRSEQTLDRASKWLYAWDDLALLYDYGEI